MFIFTDQQITEYVLMYLNRKTDKLIQDYNGSLQAYLDNPVDSLDLIELIIAKVRLDLIGELEHDIMRFYRVDPAPKDSDATSQKK